MNKAISDKKIIELIGFPVDLGAGRRGVDMGPSALRIAHLTERLEHLGYKVVDLGDIKIEIIERQQIIDPQVKYLPEIVKTGEKLAQKVEHALNLGHFPLCLGGDHSMSIGSVAGISSYCKSKGLRLGVIWIDAHADFNTHLSSPSGNIHGMPLAACVGMGHPELVNLHGFSPKVLAENCVVIGARSIDVGEKQNIKEAGITVFTMSDIDVTGIHRILSKVLKQFKDTVDHIHVSFDVDSVDPMYAPGVGTPVSGGLSYRESHLLMETIAACGCMSSLEVTEINPILDNKNQTADFVVELVASALGLKIL